MNYCTNPYKSPVFIIIHDTLTERPRSTIQQCQQWVTTDVESKWISDNVAGLLIVHQSEIS